MSGSDSSIVEEILERFLDELQEAGDPEPLLSRYMADHPELSDELCIQCFLHELEETDDAEAVLQRYAGSFPHLDTELREQAAMQRRLDQLGPVPEENYPQQLGDFRLVRLMARGGMGDVYEAVQEPLGRKVVVKTIRRGRQSAEAKERFAREQRILALLHQTNIVPVHAAGEHEDLQYFAMAYIEGATLQQLIRTLSAIPESESRTSAPSFAELAKEHSERSMTGQSNDKTELQDKPGTTQNIALKQSQGSPLQGLSTDYFQSVARMLIDIAGALHHAHRAGVIHRDLKPSNIMVDGEGHCWIIDFGLARLINEQESHCIDKRIDSPSTSDNPPNSSRSRLSSASGIMGTPAYMAPEQFQKKADVCSDVWGLGAILYELLTLTRPFAGHSAIGGADPKNQQLTPPRNHNHNVPVDLQAICLKALEKTPGDRYATAGDFAEDLQRWLRHEPINARPARTLRRVALWCRRNPGWAAAICITSLAMIVVASGGFLYQQKRAEAAEQGEKAKQIQIDEQERQALLRRIQELQAPPRRHDWYEEARKLIRKASAIRSDEQLKSYAAAMLAGMDARLVNTIEIGASWLAFDAGKNRLATGGFYDGRSQWDAPGVWNLNKNGLQTTGLNRVGPVAFRNGIPVQLRLKNEHTLQLWDLQDNKEIQSFPLPGKIMRHPLDGDARPKMAISADGSLVAASASLAPDGRPFMHVWDAASGKLTRRFQRKADTMLFASDSSFIVSGHDDGRVVIAPLRGEGRQTELTGQRNKINCLALHRQSINGDDYLSGWRLASGDDGGDIRIWDLSSSRQIGFCRGSLHAVYALSFSADGTLLASGGRTFVTVWDVALATTILSISPRYGNYITALTFSKTSNDLAIAAFAPYSRKRSVDIWRLQPGRGALRLRGLAGQIHQMVFSSNANRVAALSQHWRVGIWDLPEGRLRAVLDVPRGFLADNAGMAFSPDGRRFAFSSGRLCKLWDLLGGRDQNASTEINSWPLPPGLQDRLVFHRSGKLLLARFETKGKQFGPFSEVNPGAHPRVIRVRHLQQGNRLNLMFPPITRLNWHVHAIQFDPEGNYLAASGLQRREKEEQRQRLIACYDCISGKELWAHSFNQGAHEFEINASGQFLENGGHRIHLPAGRKEERSVPHRPEGPYGQFEVRYDKQNSCITIKRRGATDPFVRFHQDWRRFVQRHCFSRDERYLAWGHTDGIVTLADLEQVRKRLVELDLGR